MDGGAWWAAVHGVAKSRAWLSDFTFTFHFHALEKAMATHSSVLAWRIPGTEEPGGLPSMGLHRVGHDWSDLAAAAVAVIVRDYPGSAKITRGLLNQEDPWLLVSRCIYLKQLSLCHLFLRLEGLWVIQLSFLEHMCLLDTRAVKKCSIMIGSHS